MQNRQWTWISIGGLSMAAIIYFYRQISKKQSHYQDKLKKFTQTYQKSKNNQYVKLQTWIDKNPLNINQKQANNKNSNQKLVCLLDVYRPSYNSSTFKLFQRQRSLFKENNQIPNSTYVFQHQLGGNFSFIYNKEPVYVQLNDFNVSKTVLKEHKQQIHLFKGLNNIQPLVCKVITVLNPAASISIFGKIYYDSDKLRWHLEPFFITQARQMKNLIQDYYNLKIGGKLLSKIGLFFCGCIMSYFLLYKPLRSLWKKYKLRTQGFKIYNQLDFFKNKDYIMVKGQSLLNCQHCQKKNVEIAYQCGHLVLCLDCHQKNFSKVCPLCMKPSTKFLKIFMA